MTHTKWPILSRLRNQAPFLIIFSGYEYEASELQNAILAGHV